MSITIHKADHIQRHMGLDWLRIGAFGILIFYHSAMYFGPFHWVVKSVQPENWLAYLLSVFSPWRLMVLFAVSGYATAAMMAKADSGKSHVIGKFFQERSKRLLIPLIFGIAVLVPPQSWVRLVIENGYAHSFGWFWLHDAFRFGVFLGHTLPHWEHLWFLGYLWGYTALLVAAIAIVPDCRHKLKTGAAWLAKGDRLLIMPVVAIVVLRLLLTEEGLAGHGMFDDFVGDAHYVPAFLLGFMLANEPLLWRAIRRCWRLALAGSIACYAILAFALRARLADGDLPSWLYAAEIVADSAMAWMMVPVAFHFADRFLNRDHHWRAPLAEAVFPAYLVHQTVIVLVGWYLLRFNAPNWASFTVIGTSVIATCVTAYWLAKKIPWLAPLLGVNASPRPTNTITRDASSASHIR